MEELTKIKQELNKIRKETKTSNFDTIYTSMIIFIGSILFGYYTLNSLDFWAGFLGGGLALAIITQFLSIFNKKIKKVSIMILFITFAYSIILYSYILFPVQNTTFSKVLLSWRNLGTSVVLMISLILIWGKISKIID